MERLFGTDGVRGVANSELTALLAYNLGFAGARVLAGRSRIKPRILIGKDTRISCGMLEAALAAGICATGADAVSVGVIPTPAVAYLTALYGAGAGAVISASHNSFEFNGIKFFDRNGFKLPDSVEDEIEELMLKDPETAGDFVPPTGGGVGRFTSDAGAKTDYIGRLQTFCGCELGGVKIALDCANGAASHYAPDLFRRLGADVCAINCEPDGVNINYRCGSTHPEAIRGFTAERGADIGFAFDGDADRVVASDERGGLIDGDSILALLAIDMSERGALAKDTVVATVMSNLGFEIAMKKRGINLVRTAVGDRHVLEEMRENGYVLGGENSGHIICLDANTSGDGLFAAIRLLNTLFGGGGARRGPVSEQAAVVSSIPQIICNAKVSNSKKNAYLEDPVIRERCMRIEARFNSDGRVLIRPSGTEPLIRVMIESNDRELIETEAAGLAKLIEARLG